MRSKATRPKNTRPTEEPPAYYRLHALLHTMHAIERYEDQLCALMHEIQTSGALTAVVSDELRDLLEQIPSEEYQHDLNAVRDVLEPPASKPATSKRPAKATRPTAKKKSAAKKTIRKPPAKQAAMAKRR